MIDPGDVGASPFPRKILCATAHCLFDATSGAAISTRELLHKLSARGYQVMIVTATIMDSALGDALLPQRLPAMVGDRQYLKVNDGLLVHHITSTVSYQRAAMTAAEEARFYRVYLSLLEAFDPDIVMTFGGLLLDLHVLDAARRQSKKTVGILYNGSYTGHRWYRDLDYVITESDATARLYKERLGLDVHVIGSLVHKQRFIAKNGARDSLLFVTAVFAKGALIVVAIAWLLERLAPQLKIIVVEGRGQWATVLKAFFRSISEPQRELRNVELIPVVRDMAPIYARTRLLIAPSLWYESLGRVIIEAMWNGIPALVTDRNGPKEVLGDSGILIKLPDEYFKPPYDCLQEPVVFEDLARLIVRFFQDDAFYRRHSDLALAEAGRLHEMNNSIDRLIAVIDPTPAVASE